MHNATVKIVDAQQARLCNSYKNIKCKLLRTNAAISFNPLSPELNPICYLLALLAHHFLHVSRIRVKSLTLR